MSDLLPDNPREGAPLLYHNLLPSAFMWLWAKYVVDINLEKHCTACLKAHKVSRPGAAASGYSQVFSKASNKNMADSLPLSLDEVPPSAYRAIYLCGVAAKGYRQKVNYPQNLHAGIVYPKNVS